MLFEGLRICKCFFTFWAKKWFFSSMYPNMYVTVAFKGETFIAIVTEVKSFTGVPSSMYLEDRQAVISFETICTYNTFFSLNFANTSSTCFFEGWNWRTDDFRVELERAKFLLYLFGLWLASWGYPSCIAVTISFWWLWFRRFEAICGT